MHWKPRVASGLLAYALALVAFYPMLVLHFVRHHAEPWAPAILHAFLGAHALEGLLFALPWFLLGAIGHRRILQGSAGPAVLLPTSLGAPSWGASSPGSAPPSRSPSAT